MLTHIVAADVPDSGGWNVTTWIALVGALISVATLVVTTWSSSRRERTKWARETLGEAFFDFVNGSYDAGQAGKDHFAQSAEGAGAEALNYLCKALDHERNKLIHIQTRIRLLAPRKTLDAAKDVRWRIDALRESLQDPPSGDKHQEIIDGIAVAREVFVQLAKQNMSLPR